jgi:hypothetical protein
LVGKCCWTLKIWQEVLACATSRCVKPFYCIGFGLSVYIFNMGLNEAHSTLLHGRPLHFGSNCHLYVLHYITQRNETLGKLCLCKASIRSWIPIHNFLVLRRLFLMSLKIKLLNWESRCILNRVKAFIADSRNVLPVSPCNETPQR